MRRGIRWLLRGLVVAAIVLAIAAALAWSVVAFTDIPRNIALRAVERSTGLAVSVESFDTSWSGRTTLTGLAVALPGDDAPLLTAPRVVADHAGLIWIILTGDADLASLRIHEPQLTLTQQPDGRWNLQRAASLIAARRPADAHTPPSLPPAIAIDNAAVTIHPAGVEPFTVNSVSITAAPQSPSGYAFDAAAPGGGLSLTGRVDLGDDLHHSLTIKLADAHAIAAPLVADLPEPISLHAQWRGRLADDALTGSLVVHAASLGERSASGAATVTASADRLTVEPSLIAIDPHDPAVGPVTIAGGRIVADPSGFAAHGVTIEARDTRARVDARFDPASRTGHATAAWVGKLDEPAITHRGDARATLKPAAPGRYALTLALDTTGDSPAGAWALSLTASADAADPDHANWQIAIDRGRWSLPNSPASKGGVGGGTDEYAANPAAPSAIALDGVTLSGSIDGPRITLTDARADGAHGKLAAAGAYDRDTRAWSLDTTGRRFAPPVAGVDPIDFNLAAAGDADSARLTTLTASMRDLTLDATGTYDRRRDTPIDANVSFAFGSPPLKAAAGGGTAEFTDDPAAIADLVDTVRPAPSPALQGTRAFSAAVAWSGRVTGSADPLRLAADGDAKLTRLFVNRHRVGDLTFPLTATLAERKVAARTPMFDAIGGRLALAGEYRFGDQRIALTVRAQHIPLATVGELTDSPMPIDGLAGGVIRISALRDDPADLHADGEFEVDAFAMGPARFDRVTGTLTTRDDGVILLDPLQVRLGDGVGRGSARLVVRDAPSVHAEFAGENWPLELGRDDVAVRLDGRAAFDADLTTRVTTGDFHLTAHLADQHGAIGRVGLAGALTESAVVLERVESSGLSGEATGSATLPLADWRTGAGELRWVGFEPAVVARWWAPAADLVGRADLNLKVGPALEGHPLEPARFDLIIEPVDQPLLWRSVPVESAAFTGYLGRDRWIIDQSRIAAADGQIKLWASVSRRGADWFAHLRADWDRLDLDMLRLALPGQADEEPIPGRLAGRGGIVGPIGDADRLVGHGEVRLTESNLAGTDIFGALFDLLGGAASDPTGTGRAVWRLERRALRIDRLYFRNRSNQVILTGRLDDITLGSDSPITGDAVGVLRPLAGLDLPLIEDLDRLLSAYQTGWTRVRIAGTLADPHVTQATLSDIGQFLKTLTGNGGRPNGDNLPPPP